MFAIIEDGARQYRVSKGEVIRIDYRDCEKGSRIEFDRVLLVAAGDDVQIGRPRLDGMRVIGQVIDHPSIKLQVQKFQRRKNVRRLRGHRQPYTDVRIEHILKPGEASPAEPEPTATAPASTPTPATSATATANPPAPSASVPPAATPQAQASTPAVTTPATSANPPAPPTPTEPAATEPTAEPVAAQTGTVAAPESTSTPTETSTPAATTQPTAQTEQKDNPGGTT